MGMGINDPIRIQNSYDRTEYLGQENRSTVTGQLLAVTLRKNDPISLVWRDIQRVLIPNGRKRRDEQVDTRIYGKGKKMTTCRD